MNFFQFSGSLQAIGICINSSNQISISRQVVFAVTALHGFAVPGNSVLGAEVSKIRSADLYRNILDAGDVVAGNADLSLIIGISVGIDKSIAFTLIRPADRMIISVCGMDNYILLEATAVQTVVLKARGPQGRLLLQGSTLDGSGAFRSANQAPCTVWPRTVMRGRSRKLTSGPDSVP